MVKKIQGKGIYFEVDFDDSVQPQLSHPCKKPTVRKKFWKDYNKNGIDFVTEKYVVKKYGIRLKLFISKAVRKLLLK